MNGGERKNDDLPRCREDHCRGGFDGARGRWVGSGKTAAIDSRLCKETREGGDEPREERERERIFGK